MSRPVKNTSDVVTNARGIAAEQAKRSIDERTGEFSDATLLRMAEEQLGEAIMGRTEMHDRALVAEKRLAVEKAEREAVACEFERLGAISSSPLHTGIWNNAADILRRRSPTKEEATQ